MKYISVKGARQHNLKNIDISIPRDELTVITGLSGSGKSSLAFDTLYAEGQRRYVESLSAYARQFLSVMDKPDVDTVEGLSPAISIEQKSTSHNPRSTVGTITELYDFFRLLYARAANAYSSATQELMVQYSDDEIVSLIHNDLDGQKVILLAPIVRSRKGHYRELFSTILKQGFTRVRVDGEFVDLKPGYKVDRYKLHDVEIVIDRLLIDSEKASSIKQLKDDIKAYRKSLDDNQEIASDYAKNIVKIARRIEFASIYPPNALNEMQKAIVEFDNVQKSEQGGLRFVDMFLFPAGTIVSSGTSCSEQGSGRWLPKPSDTLNKFILMSKPSVGYKNIPLLWIDMMDVSKIIGFILPDWIADVLPGEYPIHTKDGVVEQNFKGRVLKVVTGDFKLFKIPVPYGHIWDSFLRVFLGLIFGILIGVPLGLFMGLNRFAKGFFDPLIELYRPVPPLAWAPLIISVLGIDNTGKVFLLFMVSLSIMIISARAGASGTQLSKIHAAHSLGASKKQILRYVIFPNSLPEILTGIRVAVGMCWGTLVAAEFLAGTTGIGFVENVAKKYFQYEVIWITIFIMGMLGLLFDVTLRKIIDKTIPWRGKG